jgi:hypothetical protein
MLSKYLKPLTIKKINKINLLIIKTQLILQVLLRKFGSFKFGFYLFVGLFLVFYISSFPRIVLKCFELYDLIYINILNNKYNLINICVGVPFNFVGPLGHMKNVGFISGKLKNKTDNKIIEDLPDSEIVPISNFVRKAKNGNEINKTLDKLDGTNLDGKNEVIKTLDNFDNNNNLPDYLENGDLSYLSFFLTLKNKINKNNKNNKKNKDLIKILKNFIIKFIIFKLFVLCLYLLYKNIIDLYLSLNIVLCNIIPFKEKFSLTINYKNRCFNAKVSKTYKTIIDC